MPPSLQKKRRKKKKKKLLFTLAPNLLVSCLSRSKAQMIQSNTAGRWFFPRRPRDSGALSPRRALRGAALRLARSRGRGEISAPEAGQPPLSSSSPSAARQEGAVPLPASPQPPGGNAAVPAAALGTPSLRVVKSGVTEPHQRDT